jgi:hypothetical protein
MTARSRLLFFVVICLCFFARADLRAQSSTAGKSFWLAFPQNAKSEFGQTIKLMVTVAAVEEAEVVLTTPAVATANAGMNLSRKLKAGETFTFILDSVWNCEGSESIEDKGIHVGSTAPVTVLATSRRKASTDSYRVMPTEWLGNEYMAVGYTAPSVDGTYTSQVTAIATADNTKLNVTLTADTKGGHHTGERIIVDLNKGQTYTVQGKQNAKLDLTGSVIWSDKPFALVTGHSCAQVPYDRIYCDVLVEMAAPLKTAGTDFVVAKMRDKRQYALRIIATQPSTEVTITPDPRTTVEKRVLMGGEFIDLVNVSEHTVVHADQPIIVAQYALSNEGDSNRVGDPFMMLIAPNTSFAANTTLSTPDVLGNWHHYLSIVCDGAAAESLEINGQDLEIESAERVGDRYIFQTGIESGTKTITSKGKLAVYSYGFGTGTDNFDSYGSYCGPW